MRFDSFIQHKKVFLVGIKGTGMTSLAAELSRLGAAVVGSDVPERFSTDAVLEKSGIIWYDSFAADRLDGDVDILVHSAAYHKETHEQIAEAIARNIPVYSYPQWLAFMSASMPSYGVAGTHGKTTASSCVEWILAKTGLSCCHCYGSHLQGAHHQTRRIHTEGSPLAGLFEACEYQDHFLDYRLDGLLVTTIEHDHPDWFATEDDVYASFEKLVSNLAEHAPLVCGTDSPLTRKLISWVSSHRDDLILITYGEHPSSMVRIGEYMESWKESSFTLSPLEGTFHSRMGALPLCLDMVGAALLGSVMVLKEERGQISEASSVLTDPVFPALMRESERFPGAAGRLDRLFTAGEVIFVDDYAHHPTEITVALEALRSRYPSQRLVVIFHPHTVSRTQAYFDRFAEALGEADVLVIRPVYASARNDGEHDDLIALGEALAEAAGGIFAPDEDTVVETVVERLLPNDVCVTMGAGNNTGLAERIAERQRTRTC